VDHHKKTKKGFRQLDFFNGKKETAEKGEKVDQIKTSKNQTPINSELAPEAITSLKEEPNNTNSHATTLSNNNLQEIETIVAEIVTQKLNEIQSNTFLAKHKSKSEEKKYESKHIGIQLYPRIKTFKEKDEPFKDTLKRVIEYAEKHRELTGGKKGH